MAYWRSLLDLTQFVYVSSNRSRSTTNENGHKKIKPVFMHALGNIQFSQWNVASREKNRPVENRL